MEKNNLIILIVIISIIAAFLFIITSGFTFKTESDKTWGQKDPVTIKDLYIYNSTGKTDEYNGLSYYYIQGNIGNKAQLFATNVMVTAKFFDSNGNLVGTNTTSEFYPKKIPSDGISKFYIYFDDPEKKINSYKLEISMK
jgi:hypothetical protein